MVYFRTFDDKMIVYIPSENHVLQRTRDGDGKEYEHIISKQIFEQLRKEIDIWQVKI